MARAISRTSNDDGQMVEAFAANERMFQLILEHLDARAWREQPTGRGVRTIAAMFCHVHNVRCKWLRLSAPHLKRPALLDRSRCTQKQASRAFAASGVRCCEMLSEALSTEHGGVRSFVRDGWARAWKPGAAMFAYMISHEAHHRGQILLLAHQLGYPLPFAASQGLWAWEKLWKQRGFRIPAPGDR